MKVQTALPPPKVGMISLGCAKNLVDAEIMLGSVLKSGMEITADSAPETSRQLHANTPAIPILRVVAKYIVFDRD